MINKKSVISKLILPTLMILCLLSLTGCGNKSSGGSTTPAPNNSQSAKPSDSAVTKAAVVTYENYLKIKLDTTYDDVKSILGEGTKKAVKADVVSYQWSEQDKNIVIQTNKGKVESKSQSDLGKTTSTLTAKQFKQVTVGMTFDNVVSILGPDYREVSTERSADAIIRSVVWMMPNSKFVKVKFQDEKVTNTYNFLK